MSTAPVASLIDDQLAEIKQSLVMLTRPGQSLCDALRLPPEARLIDSGICSAMTIKNGRRLVEVRRGQ